MTSGNISLDICDNVLYMFRMTNPAPNPPEEDDDDAPAWARRHLGMLVDLGDMGMVLARDLVRRVTAETQAAEAQAESQAGAAAEGSGEAAQGAPAGRGPAIDPALSFTRISRAVRLTIALEARMRREIEAGVFGPANDDGRRPGGDDTAASGPIDYEGIKRKHAPLVDAIVHRECDYQTRRAVEETIEDACDDPDDVERLKEELKERLIEDEVFSNRATWPIGETIALICQDLGLDPDWGRWEARPWARKEAEESPLNSPYATVVRPTRPGLYPQSGTDQYRQARGLPPLDQPPLRTARGPP